MPSIGEFSTGADVTMTVVGGVGGPITFDLITSFESSQESANIKVVGMDGNVRYDELPQGWKGTFGLTRSSGDLDDYFAAAEARYYSGGGTYSSTITETITEPDTSISQYRYTGVSLKLDRAGMWNGDKDVTQRVSFNASRRLKVL